MPQCTCTIQPSWGDTGPVEYRVTTPDCPEHGWIRTTA